MHGGIIHNSQNVEGTQVYVNEPVDKQNVEYTYNGVLALKGKEILIYLKDMPNEIS